MCKIVQKYENVLQNVLKLGECTESCEHLHKNLRSESLIPKQLSVSNNICDTLVGVEPVSPNVTLWKGV